IAQRGELTAEDTASIDIDGVIEPFWLGHGSMTINNHSAATILCCPVVAYGQAKFVGFASCLAIEGKLTYGARGTALHGLFHASMCNHQFAIVQHAMADETL